MHLQPKSIKIYIRSGGFHCLVAVGTMILAKCLVVMLRFNKS